MKSVPRVLLRKIWKACTLNIEIMKETDIKEEFSEETPLTLNGN